MPTLTSSSQRLHSRSAFNGTTAPSLGSLLTPLLVAFFALLISASAVAQRNVQPFPKEVATAKTIAIVNNTGNQAVADGAVEALKRWGKFTLAEDPDTADLTLTFDKKNQHDGSNSQTTGADGKPSYNYSVSFSSTILMKVALKNADRSFYTASTTESKKKAGAECVTSFQSAYLNR